VRSLARRELLTDLAVLFACGVACPFPESDHTGGHACDFCGAPGADALELAFCVRCDAVIHRDCAGLGPYTGSSPAREPSVDPQNRFSDVHRGGAGGPGQSLSNGKVTVALPSGASLVNLFVDRRHRTRGNPLRFSQTSPTSAAWPLREIIRCLFNRGLRIAIGNVGTHPYTVAATGRLAFPGCFGKSLGIWRRSTRARIFPADK